REPVNRAEPEHRRNTSPSPYLLSHLLSTGKQPEKPSGTHPHSGRRSPPLSFSLLSTLRSSSPAKPDSRTKPHPIPYVSFH
ncbi:hypothetical protein HAX54_037771, partial [Datura stramonium]|nr:hypothetical protein [Datura stramonium]